MPGSFSILYNSLDSSPVKRGKQFERVVKWFLKNDPEWATQVDEVWLWDEWPERWGADCGIDIIFRHMNGEHWAPEFDTKRRKWLICIEASLSAATTATTFERLGWAS